MTRSQSPSDSARPSSGGVAAGEFAAALQGLLDVSRAARSGAEMGPVLEAIARSAAETLGFRSVVLNVYRPEWDDFCVETVYGSDNVRKALLGQVYDRESWTPQLDERFQRAGAYFIPDGAYDWSSNDGMRFVPDVEHHGGPDAWHPADELFVPLESSEGQLLGVMSFGEPLSGLRPDEEQLALAVTLASHAALALEMAQ